MNMYNSGQWSVVSGQYRKIPRPSMRSFPTTGHRPLTTAFSLTELLVVIAIIVLALALAVPALNLLTGAKSTEQANNLTAGMLALARNYAIGQQKYAGVMFYLDPASGRVKAVLVWAPGDDDAIINLDLVDGIDALTLPSGILIQTIDDAAATGAPPIRQNDGYLGFNDKAVGINATPSPLSVKYGGVILFDKQGHLANKVYSLQASLNGFYTAMGVLLYATEADAHLVRVGADATLVPGKGMDILPAPVASPRVIKSQVGFVLLDEENFINNAGTPEDAQITNTTFAGAESIEEDWIDNNSVPFMINHYNGSLVKGE
jgi:type II secretory pathway pseudopilin PulG